MREDDPLRWLDEICGNAALDDVAIIEPDGSTVSYRALATMREAVAGHLRQSGVGAGDRVMLVGENCAAFAAAALAISQLRAWIVPVNARLTASEIANIGGHCRSRAFVFTSGISANAAGHGEAHGAVAVPQLPELAVAPGADPGPAEPASEDPAEQVAALFYTSGTTGRPKGVMLSHESLLFNAGISTTMRDLTRKDELLVAGPCTHIMAFATLLLPGLMAGARLRLLARVSADAVLAALRDGVSIFSAVPQLYDQLVDRLEEQGQQLNAPRLRKLSAGGAPFDAGRKQRVEACFGMVINNGYGMTEAGPTISSSAFGDGGEPGSVGFPPQGVEIRLDDKDDTGVGEIQLRGAGVMLGYYRDPQITAETLTGDGFLRTGDLGRFDGDGALHVVGRTKSVIVRSGFNVYPEELEGVLREHPAVRVSAVAGLPVEGNEEVIAFVTADEGTSAETLAAFMRERLVPYKLPQRIILTDDIPLTSTGKPRRAELVARIAGQG